MPPPAASVTDCDAALVTDAMLDERSLRTDESAVDADEISDESEDAASDAADDALLTWLLAALATDDAALLAVGCGERRVSRYVLIIHGCP